MAKPKPLTEEQKKAKRQAEIQELNAAIEQLTSTSGFQLWLKVRTSASLGRFSLNNQLLIAYQKPDATLVKTFAGWKNLNRKVKKGEHGILILRPVVIKVDITDPDTGEVIGKEHQLRGFRGLKEFDISQTEGEPIEAMEEKVIGTELLAEYWDKLVAYAKKLGYTVERVYKIPGGANGTCDPKAKHIRVKNGKRAIDDQVRTLIHEIAHAHDVDYNRFSRQDAEIIVEQTTAIILIQLGLRNLEVSAQYLADWCGGEVALVKARVNESDKVAVKIEEALGLC